MQVADSRLDQFKADPCSFVRDDVDCYSGSSRSSCGHISEEDLFLLIHRVPLAFTILRHLYHPCNMYLSINDRDFSGRSGQRICEVSVFEQ